MNLKIKSFKSRLAKFCESIGIKISHNQALKQTEDYGIWYEIGESRINANDRTSEKCPIVSVQIWTKSEYSDLPDKLEEYFDDMDYAWENQTYADYDSDTGRYHYGWTVSVI